MQLLGAAAHIKPALVLDLLPDLLPSLYQQTQEDLTLIRTVDLGPFKHKIDDGLELRKAAFECMDVLLDAAADRLFLPDFTEHLRQGLGVRPSTRSHTSKPSGIHCHLEPSVCLSRLGTQCMLITA